MLKQLVLRGSLVSLFATQVAVSACSSDGYDESMYPEPNSSGGSANAGGSTGTGGSNTYVPPTCGQTCQDYLVAWGLNDTIWFLWTQHIAGRPSGMKDIAAMCPLGGTVNITGMTSVSSGIDTVDVVYAFEDCANADEVYDLSYTGEVAMVGSFEIDGETLAMGFTSQSVEVAGSLHYWDDPEIDETCMMQLAQEGSGDSWKLNGRVCGRSFNSETALEPPSGSGSGGSGSGSGGTGAGGSSGGSNDCRCYCPDDTDCTDSSEPNPCGVDEFGIPNVCGCPVDCP